MTKFLKKNKMSNSKSISAKGHEILSLFDIDYHSFSQKITDVLMQNPDARFRLSLKRVPLKKKIKSSNVYNQNHLIK